MISLNTITQISKNQGINWATVEKDYFITLILDSFSSEEFLHENLVFKGGTALRKAYFQNYRYSEDLDFTLKKELTEKEMHISIESALEYLKSEYNAELRIRDFNSKRHFTDVKIQFVGLKGNKNSIALDFSADEIIVDTPCSKQIFNPYYGKVFSLKVYSLEEITAEKLRSLLQRTRVRDYYDLWYLLTKEKAKLEEKKIHKIFLEKVKHKKLQFTSTEQLLSPGNLEQAKAYYSSQLSNQISNLQPFEKMAKELQEAIQTLKL